MFKDCYIYAKKENIKSKSEQMHFSQYLYLSQRKKAWKLKIYTQRTGIKGAEVVKQGRQIKLMLCLEESLLNCKKIKY